MSVKAKIDLLTPGATDPNTMEQREDCVQMTISALVGADSERTIEK